MKQPTESEPRWRVSQGDALDVLRTLAPASIDCVVTSPPYAEQRSSTYGGVSENDYPLWTADWFKALRAALKPRASILLNIRPHVRDGAISDYVLQTRILLRAYDWVELDELIWRKPDAPPMGRPDRPRRSWESLHWFAATSDAYCDPRGNGTPSDRIGGLVVGGRGVSNDWDHIHGRQNDLETGIARSSDVVEVSVRANPDDCELTRHPAPYPVPLASWCIRLICPEGGTVLDPFCGSGTTGVAALRLGRSFVGIEINPEYARIARERIIADAPLFNPNAEVAA